MVLAFGHFVVSALATAAAMSFAMTIWVYSNPVFLRSMTKEQVANRPPLEMSRILIASSLATCVYFAVVGFGLLTAKRWARWISVAVWSGLCLWSVYDLIKDVSHGRWGISTGIDVATVVFAVAPVAYLLRRSTRDWFQLADRLRAEHVRRLC